MHCLTCTHDARGRAVPKGECVHIRQCTKPTTVYIFNSYTMGTSGLPDIYTRSPTAARLRAEGVYIRQTTSAHGIYV